MTQPSNSPRRGGSSSSIWVLLAVILAGMLAMRWWGQSQMTTALEEPSTTATDWRPRMPPLDVAGWLNANTPISLDDLQGKVVLLDFWATYCGPCLEKLPELAAIQQRYDDQDLVIIGLTPEGDRSLERVAQVVSNTPGMVWPIGYGAGPTFGALGVRMMPTFILYDQSGREVWKGNHLYGLEDRLTQLLARGG